MTDIVHLTGFIKGVTYKPYLGEKLQEMNIDSFDVNKAGAYGLIKNPITEIAYSKWVSPKRTRSYPFARMYNTYNYSKIITIIPVIKDEGKDGDRDLIQYSTISWMNLLNIYIVLAYYEQAEKSSKKGQEVKNKLTNQKFNIILFSNLYYLMLNNQLIDFVTRLKLTGKNIVGDIVLPDATMQELESFLAANSKTLKPKEKEMIRKLAIESGNNAKIKIQISSNSPT